MRCAIYFIPPADDPLTQAANIWLRRDPYSGARITPAIDGLTDDDHAFLTAPPRRFGFHARVKAPFSLQRGRSLEDLIGALGSFCGARPPVLLSRTGIALIENYFAIVPAVECAGLMALAADVVMAFDGFRQPPCEADMMRRDLRSLTGRQLANLANWGHPGVFDDYRFHMTLTGRVEPQEQEHVATVLARHFRGLERGPLAISQLALFVEPEPNAPMQVHSVHRLNQAAGQRVA